jgi:hypothetical protein
MKKRQRWTLGRTRRAARRREGRCRRQRPRFARRARRWFRRATNMILEVSLGLAVGYVEALERQLLAGWRGRLLGRGGGNSARLGATQARWSPSGSPIEALASYHRLGRRIFGAGWRR